MGNIAEWLKRGCSMKENKVIRLKDDVKLNDPILLVGLPGVGHVGKLVVEHLIEELDAEKIIEIYSPHFPPQVLVNEDSTVKLVNNEIFACKAHDIDLLILTGDHQSASTEGHYELGDLYLDLAEELGVSRIYTLGGFPTGQLTHTDEVIGAKILDIEIDVTPLEERAKEMEKIAAKILDIEIDVTPLEERAKEMEKIAAQLAEMEQQQQGQQQFLPDTVSSDEDLRYIG
jgi:proteasome assembly chaperone (PAC2) family protein